MLPPNLRGYSPEVVGVAQTNAKVVISQQGRVIYETQVAAGPFRIQDLSSYVTGTLDVRVEEQNGESQTFQVKTANIPYLSRPGAVRYQFVTGRPSTMEHDLDGPLFAGGEFSWGVNNGWSLFGGGLLSERYGSAALGVGRDLLEFGAISFDMTESLASLPGMKSRHGGSYRVNYSKVFEEIDSQIAFAGYRFSDRNFMTMNDYLNSREYPGAFRGGSREMYTVQLSKQFPGVNMGGYLSYDHQSYWHQPDSGRISLNLSRNFDLLDWRGLSASLTAYRQEQAGSGDNGFYFSLSMPFGYDGSRLSYSASSQNGGASQSISYNSRLNERDYLNVTAGTSPYGENVSGFYSHTGDKAQMTASLSHQGGSNTAGAISVQGGVTATAKGSTLHRAGMMGGSRILVDTDGVADVPVYSSGPSTTSDRYGKAVVADVNSYYRQSTSVDVNQLGDEVEPLGSPIRSGTLMEGTIGYQHFDMLSGTKRMVRVVREDGRPVPFAATALNEKDQQLGMVADDGVAYLAGLRENSHMVVQWGDQQRCEATLPGKFPSGAELLQLSCRPLQDKRSH
jgi:outer membrane usher protein FimD/PapC